MTSLPSNECLLKIDNCNIIGLYIKTNNAYRYLVSINSKINTASFEINFGKYDSHYIINYPIALNNTTIHIDNLDFNILYYLDIPLVYSLKNSYCYINRINNIESNVDFSFPSSIPDWNYSTSTEITYGNELSCNILNYYIP